VSAGACDDARRAVTDRLDGFTPHERYAARLRQAGLDDGPSGRRWLAAAERALREPVAVTLPFRERATFPASEARATGYRLQLRRGERLVVELTASALEPGELFVDLLALEPGDSSGASARHVASAAGDDDPLRLEEEIERDGAYIVRVQPEMLFEVRYELVMQTTPTLAFPVADRDDRAVRSFYGADRDGGRRSHAGIDIFAPRGTPVLASADGMVRRVHVTALGGKVVWVWDEERSQSLYYAHLDRQIAAEGQWVRTGDTIGLVGNTGNARTTPPHLHFGVYRRGWGAIDPWPFVRQARGTLAPVSADTGALGGWRRVTRNGSRLREALEGGATAALPAGTALIALGAADRSYRVTLPDGRQGWVAASTVEAIEPALSRARATVVRSRASTPALAMDSTADARTLPVVARFGERVLVRTERGELGWVMEDAD
jgi:murein DD-endopeptidase MepM/ murein hydrolase activator NlpD